jgi:phospholipid transport system transporter-binding protein
MIECACDDGPRSGFLPAGERWTYIGTLTFADATAVFQASRALALPATGIVDLAGLQHADSSALAVMLALKRRASAEGARLEFVTIPPAINALAHVYGVLDLLAV